MVILLECESSVNPRYVFYTNLLYSLEPKKGLIFKDQKVIANQRKILMSLIQSLGLKILKGESLINKKLPIQIYEPISFLEYMCKKFIYAKPLLKKGNEIEDKLERFKKVIAFGISSLHISIEPEIPLQSMLGETFQAKISKYDIFCEQISSNPPKSFINLEGYDFSIIGEHFLDVVAHPNSLIMKIKGNSKVIFKNFDDNQEVEWNYPELETDVILN